MKWKILFPLLGLMLLVSLNAQAGLSPKFRVYFNQAVNTSVSSGTNAISVGSHMIDTLINYINLAQYTIDIAQYEYSTPSSLATAVNNAYSRGVVVRWIYDGSGTNTGLSSLNSGIKTLQRPTGTYIMHDKFVLIDAAATDSTTSWVWSGSMDWNNTQITSDYNNTIVIQSQQLAKAYTAQFNQMWGGSGASPVSANEKFGSAKSDLGPHIFTIGGIKVELYFSPTDSTNDHILNVINSANSQLFFGVYTFTLTTDATAINTKFNAGVYTYGIIDQYSTSYSAYSTMSPVLGSNLIVYNHSPSIYHNKFLIVDACNTSSDPTVLTGSHNWTNGANTGNDENTLIIHDATIANVYYQSFSSDFSSQGGTISGCNVTANCNNVISTATQTNNDVLCYGGSTGKATVHATGSGPFGFSWSSSPGQTDSVLKNVAAGTYTVTVTDHNACSTTTSVTLNQPTQLTASATPTAAKCYGQSTGSASVSGSGGTGGYTYKWNNSQTTSSISNIAVGTYQVTVTDANSCSATASATVGQPTQLTASGTPVGATCYAGSNGSVTSSVTGGTGADSYQWSNSQTTSSISNLSAGTYTVTVTDANFCSVTASATVGQATQIIVTPSITNVVCHNGNTGSVAVSAAGGAGSYHYAWSTSPQQTTSTASNLTAGNYTLTVTDGSNCTTTATYSITQPSSGITLSVTETTAACGSSSGSASVAVTSGGGSYTYLWSTNATTAAISGLAAGGYTVTVTGTGGCSATAIAVVNSTGGPVIATNSTGTSCGAANGSASVSISSGTSPYTYAWSGGGTTDSISSLASGTYTITVTDANHCPAVASVTISASSAPVLSVASSNATCGSNNGSASVSVTDPATPFTYGWSNGGTTSSVSNIGAGNYSVTVTDQGTCTASASVTVGSFGGGDSVAIIATQTNICTGDTAELCVTAGFTSYVWSTNATSACIYVAQSGSYTVTASGNGSCSAVSAPVQVMVNNPPQVSFTQNGNVLTSSPTDKYQWYLNGQIISGATSSVYVATESGSYSVVGTSSNGCSASSTTQYITVSGIEEFSSEFILLYPNPSSLNYWQLQLPEAWIGAQYELFDADGRTISKSEVKSNPTRIENELPQGIYFIKITSGTQSIVRKAIRL